MTISQLLLNNPIQSQESVAAYCRRLHEIAPNLTVENIKRTFYRYRQRKLITVQENYVGGEKVSEIKRLRSKDLINVDLPIVGVSTNVGTGQQWVLQRAVSGNAVDLDALVLNALDSLGRESITFTPAKAFEKKALFNIITDVHAGMCVKEGFLNYDWNSQLLIKAFSSNFSKLSYAYGLYGRFEKIYLMDLGDSLDGYEGRTTRGGHELQQNMSTEQQFSLVLNTYVTYIEELLKADFANQIIVYRVENDNHSGTFGKLLNMVLKGTIQRMYPQANIRFEYQSDFMGKLQYGHNYIIPTHGKDKKHMKQNLPMVLTKRWVDYINSVIKRWGLLDKSVSIFKGDLHQLGLSSETLFKYYNFPAFSPPSGWVQHNFGAPNDIGYAMHIYGETAKDLIKIEETFDF